MGACPECGRAYDPTTAARLKPWPSPLIVILQLTWPVLALLAIVGALNAGVRDALAAVFLLAGYALLIAIPANTYIVVRSRLKKHVPDSDRTSGGLLVFRVFGTTVCVLAFFVLLTPAILLGACLISGASF